jgi:hypothetical protein
MGTYARCGHTRTASKTFRFLAQLFGLYVGNVASAFVNVLAVAVLVARIMQSLVHVCFVQTNTVTSVRSGSFSSSRLNSIIAILHDHVCCLGSARAHRTLDASQSWTRQWCQVLILSYRGVLQLFAGAVATSDA